VGTYSVSQDGLAACHEYSQLQGLGLNNDSFQDKDLEVASKLLLTASARYLAGALAEMLRHTQGAPCCVLQVRFKQHHNCFVECKSRMAMVRHDDEDSKPGECKSTAKKLVACQDSSVVLAASQTTTEIFTSGRCHAQSEECLKGRRLSACPLNLHGELFLVAGKNAAVPMLVLHLQSEAVQLTPAKGGRYLKAKNHVQLMKKSSYEFWKSDDDDVVDVDDDMQARRRRSRNSSCFNVRLRAAFAAVDSINAAGADDRSLAL
jgi:hypothetical protein